MAYLSDKDEREVPCDSCPKMNECGDQRVECMAARNWYYNGRYEDKDVGRLVRRIKVLK